MFGSQFELVVVCEEFWEIEELGNQLLDVRHVGLRCGDPCVSDRVKQTVRKVKISLER